MHRIKTSTSLRHALLYGMLAGAGLSAPFAFADEAPVAAAQSATLPEVTVTARRRAESLQSVPIAVSVVDGDSAASRNLNDLQDISTAVPTVDFRTGASNKDRTLFIRGLGTITTSPGVEPSVSTVIDGVVLARPGQTTADLLDLDRVEVLRGPQGTLFGKNASAGVINIVTKSPTATPHAYVDAAAYDGGEYRLKGGVSGPILQDRLNGQISAFSSHYDGQIHNNFNNSTIGGYDHRGARAKLVGTPTDDISFTLTADYTDGVEKVPTGVYVATNRINYPANNVTTNVNLAELLALEGVKPTATNRTVNANGDNSVHDRNGGVGFELNANLGGGFKLTSITAFRKWKNTQHQDLDAVGQLTATLPTNGTVNFNQSQDRGDVDFQQTSEELRLASPTGGKLDYVVGLYALRAEDVEAYRRDVTRVISGSPTTDFGVANFGSKDSNVSVFGEGQYHFTDALRAIAGFRLVHDDLSFNHARVASANGVPGVRSNFAATGSTSKDGYADRLGLQYDVQPGVTTYLTYSHGYKGPAYNVFFNMQAFDTNALKPETSNAYEAGVKARLFGNRLQANLAAFTTSFSNYQANFADTYLGTPVTRLINAGKVSSAGFEGDLEARPFADLGLTLAFAQTDATVDKFNCPVGAAASCNINGQPLPFSPKWKVNAGVNYRHDLLPQADLILAADVAWQTKVQYQLSPPNPDTVQKAYGIVNASATVAGKKDDWRLALIVKNLFDQSYAPYLAGGGSGGVVRWVPRDDHRYFGVDLRRSF